MEFAHLDSSSLLLLSLLLLLLILNGVVNGRATACSAIFKYHFIIFISFNRFTLNTYPLEHLLDNCNSSVQIWMES